MIEIDETMMTEYRREIEKFQAIRDAVAECDERVARESPYPNIPDMLAQLQKTHGKRRVAMFFANVINGAPWDGRYSNQSKEWAHQQRPIPQNPYSINDPKLLCVPPGDFFTNMHPIVVDGFAKHIIRGERDARTKRKSGPSR